MTTTTAPICNTSAVASIDGDNLATIHASHIADTLGGYQRSAALIVDRSDLHTLQRLLAGEGAWDQDDAQRSARILAAIQETLDAGLR